MAFQVLSGRANPVKLALFDAIRRAENSGEHALLVIVPAQYTLQAELELMNHEQSEGSFRLQILSPARLHARIFEQVGWPGGARIDEQGRVMLIHAAAQRLKKRMTWYESAVGRKGFAEKVLMQLSGFKQARIGPEQLFEMAQAQTDGTLKKKLSDLSRLYEGYEEALLGRFIDGEDEARAASERAQSAPLLQGAEVFVYGFDILSSTLAETLIALSMPAKSVTLALTLDNNNRDGDIWGPVERSFTRLLKLANAANISIERRLVDEMPSFGAPEIKHMERELYCIPQHAYHDRPKSIRLAVLKNPQDEAEFAAGLVRQLAMDRGWRWKDMAVICQRLDETYMDALRRAFAQCEVPLFLPDSRPADRHNVAGCLLSALRLVTKGYRTEDMAEYVRTGFCRIDEEEIDLFVNYILRKGLRGNRLKMPFRNLEEDQAGLEKTRGSVLAPLLELEKKTHKQRGTALIMEAIFGWMETMDICGQLEIHQDELIAMEQREWAMEGAQVWGKILAAMDQMYELLQEEAMTLSSASELLERALSVAEVKPLPLSGDAVLCGSLDHMKSQTMRVLLVLGLNDIGMSQDSGLLSEEELGSLSDKDLSGSLSAQDRLRMGRLSLKSALSFTENHVYMSYPASDEKGSALKASPLVEQIKRMFPKLETHGGLSGDEVRMRKIRLNAPKAVRNRLPVMLVEHPDEEFLKVVRRELGDVGPVKGTSERDRQLPESIAERLFGGEFKIGVSTLENYVGCPFKHFAHHTLKPEEFHEFELTRQDAGTFYHAAMEKFMRANGEELTELSEEESMARMDDVTNTLVVQLVEDLIGEGAIARAQGEELRGVARRAAAMVVKQLHGSQFMPTGLEIEFGSGEPGIVLSEKSKLRGRIDRVDSWERGEQVYTRVIDYKTGGKKVGLSEVYYGLQMQLMVYLAAATQMQGGRPAGAFYFNISDGLVNSESLDQEEIEELRTKELKLHGVVLDDDEVKGAMAGRPEMVMNVRGELAIEEEQFGMLIAHTLRKAREAFGELKKGRIEAEPVELGKWSACEYCEYRAVCQRDVGLAGRKLVKKKAKDIWELMRGE